MGLIADGGLGLLAAFMDSRTTCNKILTNPTSSDICTQMYTNMPLFDSPSFRLLEVELARDNARVVGGAHRSAMDHDTAASHSVATGA